MCHVPQDHMQGLQNISCMRLVDDETIVTPPEQFTDADTNSSTTNNLIERYSNQALQCNAGFAGLRSKMIWTNQKIRAYVH